MFLSGSYPFLSKSGLAHLFFRISFLFLSGFSFTVNAARATGEDENIKNALLKNKTETQALFFKDILEMQNEYTEIWADTRDWGDPSDKPREKKTRTSKFTVSNMRVVLPNLAPAFQQQIITRYSPPRDILSESKPGADTPWQTALDEYENVIKTSMRHALPSGKGIEGEHCSWKALPKRKVHLDAKKLSKDWRPSLHDGAWSLFQFAKLDSRYLHFVRMDRSGVPVKFTGDFPTVQLDFKTVESAHVTTDIPVSDSDADKRNRAIQSAWSESWSKSWGSVNIFDYPSILPFFRREHKETLKGNNFGLLGLHQNPDGHVLFHQELDIARPVYSFDVQITIDPMTFEESPMRTYFDRLFLPLLYADRRRRPDVDIPVFSLQDTRDMPFKFEKVAGWRVSEDDP